MSREEPRSLDDVNVSYDDDDAAGVAILAALGFVDPLPPIDGVPGFDLNAVGGHVLLLLLRQLELNTDGVEVPQVQVVNEAAGALRLAIKAWEGMPAEFSLVRLRCPFCGREVEGTTVRRRVGNRIVDGAGASHLVYASVEIETEEHPCEWTGEDGEAADKSP